jgi:hypothetical protein
MVSGSLVMDETHLGWYPSGAARQNTCLEDVVTLLLVSLSLRISHGTVCYWVSAQSYGVARPPPLVEV